MKHQKHRLPFPNAGSPQERRENREAWTRALRSGDFKQGRAYLVQRKTGEAPLKYCCLGVATSMHPNAEMHEIEGRIVGFKMHRMVHKSFLPPEVIDALGLRTSGGYYGRELTETTLLHERPDDDELSLARLNDYEVPFSQIADLIDSEPNLVRLEDRT